MQAPRKAVYDYSRIVHCMQPPTNLHGVGCIDGTNRGCTCNCDRCNGRKWVDADWVDLDAIERRANAAAPGPWQAWRDGNQYINVTWKTEYSQRIASELLRGASVLKLKSGDPLPRPWNPWAFRKEDPNLVRLTDADADFIAAARTDVPALIQAVRKRDARIAELEAALKEKETP